MFFINLCSLCYSPIFCGLCYSSTCIIGMCYEDRNRQIFFLSLFPISYSHLSPRIPRSSHEDMLKGEKEKETQQSVFASQPIKLFKNYLTVIDRQTLSRERTWRKLSKKGSRGEGGEGGRSRLMADKGDKKMGMKNECKWISSVATFRLFRCFGPDGEEKYWRRRKVHRIDKLFSLNTFLISLFQNHHFSSPTDTITFYISMSLQETNYIDENVNPDLHFLRVYRDHHHHHHDHLSHFFSLSLLNEDRLR